MQPLGTPNLYSQLVRALPVYDAPAQVVLIVTAGLLFYVALTDLRTYRIRNEVVGLLAILFVVHALLSGRWTSIHWNLAFAALMFVALLLAYARRVLGGGDVKILTVAFLWTGLHAALLFAIFLLAFSVIHVLALKTGVITGTKNKDGRAGIAYAPSIAAALIATFISGALHPLTQTVFGPM